VTPRQDQEADTSERDESDDAVITGLEHNDKKTEYRRKHTCKEQHGVFWAVA